MPTKVINSIFACFLLLSAIPGAAVCQDTGQQDQQPEKAKEKSTTSPRGASSLIEDAFLNLRHRVGFSFGVFEVYQNNLYQTSQNMQAASSTAVTARVYANMGSRKSTFHIDIGAGYQKYNGQKGQFVFEPQANTAYRFQLSRRSSLDIRDNFSSTPNNYSLISTIFPFRNATPSSTTGIMLPRQRTIQNNLTAELAFSAGKNSFGLYGGYSLYRFKSSTQQNSDGFSVGASYSRQFTSWLALGSVYSYYLNRVNPIWRDTIINRLQVGGFTFKLGDNWLAGVGGGVDWANTFGTNLLSESGSASLTWSSPSNLFSVRYNHGFTSAIGISGILQSDLGQLSFGSRLTSRLNLQLSAFYQHGYNFYSRGISTGGGMDFYSGMGGLQLSLLQGLIASVNMAYWDQRAQNILGLPDSLKSYAVYAGLQYVFPSGNR